MPRKIAAEDTPRRQPTREEKVEVAIYGIRRTLENAQGDYAKAVAEVEARLQKAKDAIMPEGWLDDTLLSQIQWKTTTLATAYGASQTALTISRNLAAKVEAEGLSDEQQLALVQTWTERRLLEIATGSQWQQYSTNPVANVIEVHKLRGEAKVLEDLLNCWRWSSLAEA